MQKRKKRPKKERKKIRSPNNAWIDYLKAGITETAKDSRDLPLRHCILLNIE